MLYAIAKGTGGLYGGILSTLLIVRHGFPFAITVAGVMAIAAGLIIVPLRFRPPVRAGVPTPRADAIAGE